MATKPTAVPLNQAEAALPLFPAEFLAKLPALFWTTDHAFCLTLLAGGALEKCGVDASRFLGQLLDALFHTPSSTTKARDAHFLAISGESCTFEFELAGRDFHAQVRALRNNSGKTVGAIGIATDQTDQLVAQRALRMSEQNYRLLIDEAPHAICRCTAAGNLLQVNRAMQEMLGYSETDLLVRNLHTEIFSQPEQYEDFFCRVRRAKSLHSFEAQWLHSDGRSLSVTLGGRAVYDVAGELLYIDLFAENITERKQLEEQLAHAQKMQAVGQLAGGIAHDFNNLLTVIRGQAEMMGEEMLNSDPLLPRLEELERAAERASALTRQLLAFSRKQVLQAKVIDLNETVTNMSKMLGRLIGGNIELVFTPDPKLRRVKIDPGQMEQVLMNLAVNARDAMPEGGRLTIETNNVSSHLLQKEPTQNPSVDYVLLSVADNGHGMDKETRKRIFEPFFTTKKAGKGTGLGLSVVYGVIKQSGGQIRVQSQPGLGTVFNIYLPSTEAPTDEVEEVTRGKVSGGTETILLVEDDEAIRHMLALFLRTHGYHVLVAANGKQAEEMTKARHVDLLLTDMMMPKMGGRELVTRLRKALPNTKIVLMSGHPEDPQFCPEGVRYLQKPFSMHEVSAVVRDVLEGSVPPSVPEDN